MSTDNPFLSPLKGHATAIGYVCINWAWLEFIAESVVMQLLSMRVDDPYGHCVMVNTNIRDKLAMIKSIGFLRRPSDDWFNRLEALVNRIDNDVRANRNRVVHDIWRSEPDGATTRTQPVASIIKPQAGERSFVARKQVAQSDDEVMAVSNEIVEVTYSLWDLAQELPNFRESIAR